MIQKKFEELQKLEQEMQVDKNPSESDQDVDEQTNKEFQEELFKRTSSFTPGSLHNHSIHVASDQHFDNYFVDEFRNDGWHIDDDNEEEDDDETNNDEEYYNFSEVVGGPRKSRKTLAPRGLSVPKKKSDQITIGIDGVVYHVRRRFKSVDPNLPVFTKLPPEPIPHTWAKTITHPALRKPADLDTYNYFECNILTEANLKILGEFEAMLIDPPWNTEFAEMEPGKEKYYVTVNDIKKLELHKIMPVGIIFIWVEKELIPDIFQLMTSWGYGYIENFVWVKQSLKNQYASSDYCYFRKTKHTLLMFRKQPDDKSPNLELRHQRNADVAFDFVKREKNLTTDKPDFVYKLIETLLPEANYSEETKRGKLLELWCKTGTKRRGWTSISQKIED